MSADLSRTAGVVAYLLLSAWMVLALVPVRADLRKRLGLLALGAVAAHGLFLLPDEWLRTSLAQLLVPFTSEYRPLWTGLGVLAAYGMAGIAIAYVAGRRHVERLVPVAWALAALHVIGAGADAGSWWLRIVLAVTIAAGVVLIVQRGLGGGGGSAGTEPAPMEQAPDRPAAPRPGAELGLFR